MLTNKIISSSFAFALTASVAMLAGCPTAGTVDPNASVSPSASASVDATPSSATPSSATPSSATPTSATPTSATPSSAAPSDQPASSAPASPTNSSQPVGQTGGTSDIKERATFNGKVYDPNGIPVEGAKVTAKSVDPAVTWVGEEQVTTNGAFVFRNAPVGARVEITTTKDGWTTRTRTEVLKSNLQGDPTANVFDFGGLNAGNDVTSSFYAIQDEPEIVSVKVNGRIANNSGGFPTGGAVRNNGTAIANLAPTGSAELKSGVRGGLTISNSLSGVDNGLLDIELVFSEPVKRDTVQNNFKVLSQDFDIRQDGKGFEIDENLGSISFNWAADDKSVLVKAGRPILTTTSSPEARYLLKWTNPFKDKTDKNGLTIGQGNVSPTGLFKYNPGTNNDFNVFATKIDDQSPRMLSIQAIDGGAANDVVRMTFNEPLDVINQSSLALGLGDPTDPNNLAGRQLWAYNTANTNADGRVQLADGTFLIPNQATMVGYTERSANLADLKLSFMLGRLVQNITTQNQTNVLALAQGQTINGTAVSSVPSRGNPAATLGNGSLLRFAKIDGNQVTLEFAPEAFNRNEKILVAVGKDISTSYTDTSRNIPRTELNVSRRSGDAANIFPPYSTRLKDPAGNNMSTSNSSNSGNLQVDDSLRVATAS